jgi:hypothetical protein
MMVFKGHLGRAAGVCVCVCVTGAGGDDGIAQMSNRREISAGSGCDQLHSLISLHPRSQVAVKRMHIAFVEMVDAEMKVPPEQASLSMSS